MSPVMRCYSLNRNSLRISALLTETIVERGNFQCPLLWGAVLVKENIRNLSLHLSTCYFGNFFCLHCPRTAFRVWTLTLKHAVTKNFNIFLDLLWCQLPFTTVYKSSRIGFPWQLKMRSQFARNHHSRALAFEYARNIAAFPVTSGTN